MKRRTIIWLAALMSIVSVSGTSLGSMHLDQTVDMPITETRDVVIDWLNGAGFQIYHQRQSRQVIDLIAEKGSANLHIVAQPHSPLATHITVDGIMGARYARELQQYLEAYINLPSTQTVNAPAPVPAQVSQYRNTVVCIYAAGPDREVQLTGFIVDRGGKILCTAHDLDAGQTVSVALSDGREISGIVAKLQHLADVALIETDTPLDWAVNLQQGRFMLENGDRLFSITCANGGTSGIQGGVVDGPPRRVSGMPLWQSRMHIEHGSSGSPVFDSHGRLAAMVKGRFRGTNSIGFLIPFETLLNFLERY